MELRLALSPYDGYYRPDHRGKCRHRTEDVGHHDDINLHSRSPKLMQNYAGHRSTVWFLLP